MALTLPYPVLAADLSYVTDLVYAFMASDVLFRFFLRLPSIRGHSTAVALGKVSILFFLLIIIY